jgi:uncharacterized protein (TIGR02646 family)
MKCIIKKQEPQESIDWKSNDKMFQKGKPNWNRFPTNLKDALRAEISKEQGYICCYCERRISNNDFHLEHIKPKGIKAYSNLQLDYLNLICSCQLELEKGERRHCGNSKASWYVENEFVSPLELDCEKRFKYSGDGQIYPIDENDLTAKKTIEKLKLDIDKLNSLRSSAIEPFLDENLSDDDLKNLVDGYLIDKDLNNGFFNEFYTTIKYLFKG